MIKIQYPLRFVEDLRSVATILYQICNSSARFICKYKVQEGRTHLLKCFAGVNQMKKSVLLELVASYLSDSENKAFKELLKIARGGSATQKRSNELGGDAKV